MLSNDNPGCATRLINYETALSGGYRRINGYTPIAADPPDAEVTSVANPAEGKVLGVWGFIDSTSGNFDIMAARKLVAGAEYAIYLWNGTDTWAKINTGTTQVSTGVDLVRAEVFTTETGNNICFTDGVNKALIFDSASWYQIDAAGAGGAGDPGGDQCIDAPAISRWFKNTLFLFNDATSPTLAAYSAPNDPLTWTAAAGGGQLPMGFDIVDAMPFRDELYIFGTEKIRKAIADLDAGFVLQDVTNNIGCIARDSVIEINSNIVFFAPDGVRTVAGTEKIGDVEIGPFSDNIHNTITNITNSLSLGELRSVVLRDKTQFRYFISNDVSSRNDAYGIIGCVDHKKADWEFMEINGFEVSCCWSGYNDEGEEIVLHGDYDGFVYYQENGSDFDGDDITAIYTGPYLDLGDTTVRKLFRRVDLFTRAEGSFEANLEVSYDWGDSDAINPPAYVVTSTGGVAMYDSGLSYDDGALYGGTSQPVFKTNIQGSAFSAAISITSTGNDPPHTLQGMVINFSIKGRE